MRKILILALVFLLVLTVVIGASAAPSYVIDKTGTLTESEIYKMESTCREIKNSTGFDVVILLVNSLYGKSAREYTQDYYNANGYGNNGIIFMLSLEYRDYYIATAGAGIDLFDDSFLDDVWDVISEDLSNNNFAVAFPTFINYCESAALYYESSGGDVNYETPKDMGKTILISAVVGIIAGVIVCVIFVKQLKSVAPKMQATQYTVQGSSAITRRADMFLRSHTTRVKRQTSSSSGGRSGGGGRSFGGRGGKF